MILSDDDIVTRIRSRQLYVHPLDLNKDLQPSGIDLHLADELVTFEMPEDFILDFHYIENMHNYSFRRAITDKGEKIPAHGFALASSIEYIKIPGNLSAEVKGRSSIGRLGLQIHCTAGYIEPGFEGTLTFELFNALNRPIIVYPNMRICQIVFYELSHFVHRNYNHPELDSHYQGQIKTTESKFNA